MKTNQANAPPGDGRRFYYVMPNEDGTVDVFLRPEVYPMTDQNGCTDYDITIRVARNIDPSDADYCGDLEGHIRAHYEAWCEIAEAIEL